MDFDDSHDFAYGLSRMNNSNNPFDWFDMGDEDDDGIITRDDVLDFVREYPDAWHCNECDAVGLSEFVTFAEHRFLDHAETN